MTYRSETELREHEFTHVRSYNCMECDFAERPFASRQDLRKHRVKYHTTLVDFAIPLQIRSLATKSIPPLRRKTQRLGIRESNVGQSPVDRTAFNDLRPKMFNTRSAAHQDPQTIREYAAAPNDLKLTDTSERNDVDASSGAGLVSTSCAESGITHKQESVDKMKATHSPRICSMSEASSPVGEPIQTAPETSHDNSLRIDHIGISRQEPNASNKTTPKTINIVHVDDSTESNLRSEDVHSEEDSVDSRVSHYVLVAAKIHFEKHAIYIDISIDEEARRIRGLSKIYRTVETQLEWDAKNPCLHLDCWSFLIGSYIDATFATENAVPGISVEDAEERLSLLMCAIERYHMYTILELPTRFLPQEMIRFERAMKLDSDTVPDLPTFMEYIRLWGPRVLKDCVESLLSVSNKYLDVEKEDVEDWLYNNIKIHANDDSYLCFSAVYKDVVSWIRGRRRATHPELFNYILRLIDRGHYPVYVKLDDDHVACYILSLLCKERNPTEMVRSLKEYLKPSK